MRLSMLSALAMVLSVAVPVARAASSDEAAVLRVVRDYTAFVNAAAREKAVALCAPQASIIDDFPPHAWVGASACSDWWRDLETFEKANGITGDHVALSTPRHVSVTGDRAYVVIPATYRYMMKGKPVTEAGSTWIFTLERSSSGWEIVASAWGRR